MRVTQLRAGFLLRRTPRSRRVNTRRYHVRFVMRFAFYGRVSAKTNKTHRYYAKHTKSDRLDSHVLARLPLLHPEGLHPIGGLGPAEPLRLAVRRRVKLVEWSLACRQRFDVMLDLLGPGYAEVLGGARYGKTVLEILERYGDPRKLRRTRTPVRCAEPRLSPAAR